MSHGGIKDGDLDMLYGDSKMATYVCCIGIQRWRHRYVIRANQRWRHRYVIWGIDGDIGMSYGDSKMAT